MQYSNNILEKYESRPRKWWLYTLIVFIMALLLSWSASSVTFKGFAAKGTEVAKGIFWGLVKPDMNLLFSSSTDGVPYLLMETVCATGIRVSEVRYITVEAAQRGRAEISLKGKIRVILLAGKLCRKLLKYAKKQKITSGAIFRTRSGKYLSRRQIWGEMKQLCKTAGVSPEKVYPHNLRHLFARTFYHACKDIARLADVLGHSSIETTRIYLLTTGDEQLRQLDRLGLVS